ncbi:MAG TPA: hypothetical protein DCS67_08325, partial [Clostridiales bacterium UBA8960]|nr:hypothetical protein [Clostridiales bacterium UBA8960]
VHSDELWLKGIADEMARQKHFNITEPFFDLYPRVVHPFRWLYNIVLISAGALMGSSIFTMRFVSLVFGTLSLFQFSKIMSRRSISPWLAFGGTLLLSLDIQFIYSSHMGRQETFILFLLLSGLLMALSEPNKGTPYIYSILVLLGMGVHPNSFILGVAFSAILFYQFLSNTCTRRTLLTYFGTTCIGVALYAVVGFLMNPQFVTGYMRYGSALGVDAPLLNRFEGFYWYLVKLYQQIGGTYDLMDIKLPLILSAILMFFWACRFISDFFTFKRHHEFSYYPFLTTLAILLSLLIIGRYNQTAVVFLSPFIIWMAIESISWMQVRRLEIKINVVVWVLLALWGFNLYANLSAYDRQRYYTVSYEDMLSALNEWVPADSTVLSNLNTIVAFSATQFYDVRNLGYLDGDQAAFERYIETRGITHIILHEEMDYIARNSERWGFLYVNMDYYESMQNFLKEKTQLIGSFENPLYAMRISRYSGTYPWRTFVYKVME